MPGTWPHDPHRGVPDHRGPVKLTVGLGPAYWLVKHGSDASHAAAGAITGVTVGTIVALVYMLMNFPLITRGREEPVRRPAG